MWTNSTTFKVRVECIKGDRHWASQIVNVSLTTFRLARAFRVQSFLKRFEIPHPIYCIGIINDINLKNIFQM